MMTRMLVFGCDAAIKHREACTVYSAPCYTYEMTTRWRRNESVIVDVDHIS